MDSKAVNREIRGAIWPVLKEHGFTAFSTRTAWRHGDQNIDVVNFQSFNSHNAGVLGVTTFSFAVNLGTYLRYIPPQWPPKKIKNGLPFPAEYECQFRGGLVRSISQPQNKHSNIWSVEPNGRNLAWCINDVAQKAGDVQAWFRHLDDKAAVLRILQEDEQRMPKLWGFGNKPSPIRSYLIAYLALNLGHETLADLEFEKAVASGCFVNLFSDVQGARFRAL